MHAAGGALGGRDGAWSSLRWSLLVLLALQALGAIEPAVEARLLSAAATMPSGATTTVAVELEIPEPWHVYWRNPGQAGLATRVEWDLPAGVTASALRWPRPPQRFDQGGIVGFGYAGRLILHADITFAEDFAAERARIAAEVHYLACAEVCLPGTRRVSATIARGPRATADVADALWAAIGEPPWTLTAELGSDGGLVLRASDGPAPERAVGDLFPALSGWLATAVPSIEATAEGWVLHADPATPRVREAPARLEGLVVVAGTAYRLDVPLPEAGKPAGR